MNLTEQNTKYFKLYKATKDFKYRDHIFTINRPMVHNTVRYILGKHKIFEFDDVVQCANMGLLRCIEKFNVDFGYTFSTYAMQSIVGFSMVELSKTIGIPRYIITKAYHLLTLMREGKSIDECVEILDITEEQVLGISQVAFPLSYDVLFGKPGMYTQDTDIMLRFIPDELKRLRKSGVFNAKNAEEIYTLYAFGYAYADIGTMYGISKQRVHQVICKVLKNLQKENL